MRREIAVLPGDGVGPEVIQEAVKVLTKIAEKFGHQFTFKEGMIGAAAIDKTGNPLPDGTLDLCKKSDAILFGAIGDPKYDNDPKARVRPEQGLLKLRKELGLFANLRPTFVFPALLDTSPLKAEIVRDVDFLVVRELTSGIYFGKPRGRSKNRQRAFDTCVYTKKEIVRVAQIAYEIAQRQKKKVTVVDKANVLETSRLWRETIQEFSQKYPQVKTQFLFVDNASQQIIKKPSQFDVILTENMFGDILTDEASVLAGSLGMLPSASIGLSAEVAKPFSAPPRHIPHVRAQKSSLPADNSNYVLGLYEPIHGSYPKAAGKNTANPIAAILSVEMMLKYSFGLEKEWRNVWNAVWETLDYGWRTKDIATKSTDPSMILGTNQIGEKIMENI